MMNVDCFFSHTEKELLLFLVLTKDVLSNSKHFKYAKFSNNAPLPQPKLFKWLVWLNQINFI